VIGVVAAVDVPIIHLSVQWWRTLHPQPIVLRAGDVGGCLPGSMFATLLASLVAFTLLLATLILARYRLAALEDEVEWLWVKRALRERTGSPPNVGPRPAGSTVSR
jgi:heme exporter protein C